MKIDASEHVGTALSKTFLYLIKINREIEGPRVRRPA